MRQPRVASGVTPDELDELAPLLETCTASEIIAWAVRRFGAGLSLVSSFQHCVLVDLAVRVDPAIDVVYLDTGFAFPESLAFVEQLRQRYQLDLRVVRPAPEDECWLPDSEMCCERRKIAPLERALAGRVAWMSGLQRSDSATRAAASVLSWDAARRMAKINPIATWSAEDLERYRRRHGLPEHPLVTSGYLSIGCAPCTVPVAPGAEPRSGRWPGSAKTECGLHT